jgi:hypothetical protein
MIDPQQTNLNQTSAPKIEISQTQQNASIAISELELQIVAPNDTQQQVNINAKPIETPINTSSFKKTENSINDVMVRSEQLQIEESAPTLETSLPNQMQVEEDKGSNTDITKTVTNSTTIGEASYLDRLLQKYREAPNWRRLIG